MFENLHRKAKIFDADVVKGNFYSYKTQGDVNEFTEVLMNKLYDNPVNSKEDCWVTCVQPSIWSGIYKNAFLKKHNIQFLETPGASYQDTAFSFQVLALAKKIVFDRKAYIHYRIDNENSSVNSTKKVFSICNEMHAIEAFLNYHLEIKNRLMAAYLPYKFNTYLWNYSRLSGEDKKLFKDVIALEFIHANYEGNLDKGYFTEENWKKLNEIMSTFKTKN